MLNYNLLKNLSKPTGLVALSILAVVLPFLMGEYYVYVLVLLVINLIVVVSFRLVTTMGSWNMAHIPIVGLGGYVSAILTTTLGWPFWLTLPLAGLVAALFAWILSYPLTRITGFAFFIASFAAGEAMRLVWTRLRVPFGAHEGIDGVPLPRFFGVNFGEAIPYYFLALVIAALCLLIMYRVERSRIGDDFKAIASNDNLSRSVGINIARNKTLALVIGAFFAGIAGALFVHHWAYVDPTSFSFTNTLYLIVWVIFGGVTNFIGPIIGLIILTIVRELLLPLAQWIPMFYGIILILVLLFLPGGLESIPERISKWWTKRKGITGAKELGKLG